MTRVLETERLTGNENINEGVARKPKTIGIKLNKRSKQQEETVGH